DPLGGTRSRLRVPGPRLTRSVRSTFQTGDRPLASTGLRGAGVVHGLSVANPGLWCHRAAAHQQGDNRQHDKHDQQNLADPGRIAGDPAESEDRGDDRNHEENKRPAEHGYLATRVMAAAAAAVFSPPTHPPASRTRALAS